MMSLALPSGRFTYLESAVFSRWMAAVLSAMLVTILYGCEPACVSGVPSSLRNETSKLLMPKPGPAVAKRPLLELVPVALPATTRKSYSFPGTRPPISAVTGTGPVPEPI